MQAKAGFSLLEVLIALGLVTSTSMALLSQQTTIASCVQEIVLKNQSVTIDENARERAL